jgi:hypothetical protein
MLNNKNAEYRQQLEREDMLQTARNCNGDHNLFLATQERQRQYEIFYSC